MPLMRKSGMNTATSDIDIEKMMNPISPAPAIAAAIGVLPPSLTLCNGAAGKKGQPIDPKRCDPERPSTNRGRSRASSLVVRFRPEIID